MISTSSPPRRYLLVGNPNSGKTTLFNRLTGLRQKTGNFQGSTVEKKVGIYPTRFHDRLEIWDLPGAFSMEGINEDKKITAEIVQNADESDRILYVMDSTQIERSFQFLTSILDRGLRVLVVLTMLDLLQRRGLDLDLNQLEKCTGIQFVPVNPKTGEGIETLIQLLEDEESFRKGIPIWSGKATDLEEEYILKSIAIKKILSNTLIKNTSVESLVDLDSIDSLLLHPVYGLIIFLGIMAVVFQFLFHLAEFPMELIAKGILFLQNLLRETIPQGPLGSLVIDGALGGVGAILAFLPQICLLFFFIGIMEESGYIARASFLMDKFMGKFGMNGKAFIPILSSAACAVPAILSTRTIESREDRITTILIVPLIMCSARYPVYILVIGTVFPQEPVLGYISIRGIVLFFLFVLGLLTSLTFGLLFKKLLLRKSPGFFILELPTYRMPSIVSLLQIVWVKVKSFLVNAGRIILTISILLWFISYYPLQRTETGEYRSTIKTSYAAAIGKIIEPAIEPLGFDWKIGVAILASFAAREVMVSTLAILYELDGEDEESTSLREAMRNDTRPDGSLIWTPLTGISILIFFAFANQCMSTLAVTKKETNSYVFPAIQFLYMTVLAYVSSFLVYQVGTLLEKSLFISEKVVF